jgi:hypothetical protein
MALLQEELRFKLAPLSMADKDKAYARCNLGKLSTISNKSSSSSSSSRYEELYVQKVPRIHPYPLFACLGKLAHVR